MREIKEEVIKGKGAGSSLEMPEAVRDWLESRALEREKKPESKEQTETSEETERQEQADLPENPEGKGETDVSENPDEGEDADITESPEEKNDIEELLEKIFDCDEEDFSFEDFDFEDENLEKILDYFRPEKWSTLDMDDKRRVIMAFCAYLTVRLDLPQMPKITFYYGSKNEGGGYCPATNEIKINLNFIGDGKETLNTAAHEMRHAYQRERADRRETETDKLYLLNFQMYVKPELIDGKYVNFDVYESQLVEAEARAFADKFSEKVGEKE